MSGSNTTARTQFLDLGNATYAYRRFGAANGHPLLFLQHSTGTLDNWDHAVTDPIASRREVILFDNAGVGRSSGEVPQTIAGMAGHAFAFLDGLGLEKCDVLGFSLGGMVAQQMVQDRPSIFRKMILVGTAPRGGEEIMHIEKPSLATFFTASPSSQAASSAYLTRLQARKIDHDIASGPEVARAQMVSFREWEQHAGDRFADLKNVLQPVLVVSGVRDEMIPVRNSYWLAEHLANAMLLTYPDAGHGAMFQFHESFTDQIATFLERDLS